MKKIMVLLCSIVLVLAAVNSSNALTIIGYDVTNTRLTGSGNWYHTYDGSKTLVGGELYDYTGGSGTMNDGLMGTGYTDTHVFWIDDAPTITVYLDQIYTINQIDLLSFEMPPSDNAIPGNITGLSITVGVTTQAFSTVGFGPIQFGGWPAHERIDLTSSVLGTIATDQITFSAFTTTGTHSFNFCISEFELSANPVPEPATMLLLGSGIFGLAGFRRKRATKGHD